MFPYVVKLLRQASATTTRSATFEQQMSELVGTAIRSNVFDKKPIGSKQAGQGEEREAAMNPMPAERPQEKYVAPVKEKPREHVFEKEVVNVSPNEDDAQLWEKFASTSKFCAYCERGSRPGHEDSPEHKTNVKALRDFRQLYRVQIHKIRRRVGTFLDNTKHVDDRISHIRDQLQHALNSLNVCIFSLSLWSYGIFVFFSLQHS